MDKYIIDKHTGLKYELVGDYYVIAGDDSSEDNQQAIGLWGQRHLRYLKDYRECVFAGLLLSGRLWSHLAEINQQAEDRLALLTDQMKRAEGITEQLKATDQLEWVRHMNSIRHRAEEIVYSELIYA